MRCSVASARATVRAHVRALWDSLRASTHRRLVNFTLLKIALWGEAKLIAAIVERRPAWSAPPWHAALPSPRF